MKYLLWIICGLLCLEASVSAGNDAEKMVLRSIFEKEFYILDTTKYTYDYYKMVYDDSLRVEGKYICHGPIELEDRELYIGVSDTILLDIWVETDKRSKKSNSHIWIQNDYSRVANVYWISQIICYGDGDTATYNLPTRLDRVMFFEYIKIPFNVTQMKITHLSTFSRQGKQGKSERGEKISDYKYKYTTSVVRLPDDEKLYNRFISVNTILMNHRFFRSFIFQDSDTVLMRGEFHHNFPEFVREHRRVLTYRPADTLPDSEKIIYPQVRRREKLNIFQKLNIFRKN